MNEVNDRGYQLIKQELFKYLNADSNAYKDSYLLRRIRARMRKLGINDFMEYYRIIKKNKQELDDLLLTVAINVTEFFRDPIVWKTIERKVLPRIDRIQTQTLRYHDKNLECSMFHWPGAILDSHALQ